MPSTLSVKTPPAGLALRDERELELMRQAGRIVALTHEALQPYIRPGTNTAELNAIADDTIRSLGGTPTFLGYQGFPATICTSLNDIVVHGIPNPRDILHDGDIISIDIGVTYKGWVGDSAWTYPVGEVSPETLHLLNVTEAALYAGIEQARPDKRLGDISAAIQTHVEAAGLTVVREFTGHGIGREMHEAPQVLNYGLPDTGLRLRPGMTLALEPMVTSGGWRTRLDSDGWTVRTMDGARSAHFEHTIAITSGPARILTHI